MYDEYNADQIKNIAARSCSLLNNITVNHIDCHLRASAIYQSLSFAFKDKDVSRRMLEAAAEVGWYPFAATLGDSDIQNAELLGEDFENFPEELICVSVQGILLSEMRSHEKEHDPKFLRFIKNFDARCEEVLASLAS